MKTLWKNRKQTLKNPRWWAVLPLVLIAFIPCVVVLLPIYGLARAAGLITKLLQAVYDGTDTLLDRLISPKLNKLVDWVQRR